MRKHAAEPVQLRPRVDHWGELSCIAVGLGDPAGRLVVTMDRGFGDVRAYPPGSHGGIVVLRMDQQTPRRVAEAVRKLVATLELAVLRERS